MLISFSSDDVISTFLRANLYESVAVHSKVVPLILKFIPVNIGRDSCKEVANDVCLIIFLNTFLFIKTGVFVSDKSISGNSSF